LIQTPISIVWPIHKMAIWCVCKIR